MEPTRFFLGGGVETNSTFRAPPQVNHGNKDMERGGKGFC